MKAWIAAAAFWIAAATQPAAAQQVMRLAEGAGSPPALISDVAWLAGSWEGTGLGGQSHESWLPPVGGQMAGVFHQSRDGELQFYELLQFVERDGSLVLRLKHFNDDLSGWEYNSAEAAIEFPLVEIDCEVAYFDGLTYRLEEGGQLVIHLELHSQGQSRIETFRLTRIR